MFIFSSLFFLCGISRSKIIRERIYCKTPHATLAGLFYVLYKVQSSPIGDTLVVPFLGVKIYFSFNLVRLTRNHSFELAILITSLWSMIMMMMIIIIIVIIIFKIRVNFSYLYFCLLCFVFMLEFKLKSHKNLVANKNNIVVSLQYGRIYVNQPL